VEANDSIFIGI